MTSFQILGISGVGLVALATLAAAVRRRLSWPVASAWLALWLTAALFLARPGLSFFLAQALGISRGADLVFYCAILAMLVGFFLVYVRMRRMEENITRLVRHLAIHEPAAPPADGAPHERSEG